MARPRGEGPPSPRCPRRCAHRSRRVAAAAQGSRRSTAPSRAARWRATSETATSWHRQGWPRRAADAPRAAATQAAGQARGGPCPPERSLPSRSGRAAAASPASTSRRTAAARPRRAVGTSPRRATRGAALAPSRTRAAPARRRGGSLPTDGRSCSVPRRRTRSRTARPHPCCSAPGRRGGGRARACARPSRSSTVVTRSRAIVRFARSAENRPKAAAVAGHTVRASLVVPDFRMPKAWCPAASSQYLESSDTAAFACQVEASRPVSGSSAKGPSSATAASACTHTPAR